MYTQLQQTKDDPADALAMDAAENAVKQQYRTLELHRSNPKPCQRRSTTSSSRLASRDDDPQLKRRDVQQRINERGALSPTGTPNLNLKMTATPLPPEWTHRIAKTAADARVGAILDDAERDMDRCQRV